MFRTLILITPPVWPVLLPGLILQFWTKIKTPSRFCQRHLQLQKISFTLIELLVVISIIAILSGLLLPVLKNARGKGLQSRCEGNLRQISLGVTQYDIDNSGYFPCVVNAVDGESQAGGWTFYSSYPCNTAESFDPSQGTLYSYVPLKDVFVCPGQIKTRQGNDYASNGLLADVTLDLGFHGGISSSKVKTPSYTFLFVEEDSNDNGSTNDGYQYVFPTGNDKTTDRHVGMGNFSFCDGHVRSLPPYLVVYPNPFSESRYELE